MGLPVAVLISSGESAVTLAQTLRKAGWACLVKESFGGPLPQEVAAVLVDPSAVHESVGRAGALSLAAWPGLPTLIAGDGEIESAIEALRAGATDYLSREAPAEDFAAALSRALVSKTVRDFRLLAAAEKKTEAPLGELWGESPVIRSLRERIAQAALSDATAVVLGETGTGKELVARLLHAESSRSRRPFVVVSC